MIAQSQNAARSHDDHEPLPEWLKAAVLGHGFSPRLLTAMRFEKRPSLFPGRPQRGHLSIGYDAAGQHHETGIIDTHRVEDVETFVRDKLTFSAFVVKTVQAMPERVRPTLPSWAYQAALADERRKHKQRAARLARRAADGHVVNQRNSNSPELPF